MSPFEPVHWQSLFWQAPVGLFHLPRLQDSARAKLFTTRSRIAVRTALPFEQGHDSEAQRETSFQRSLSGRAVVREALAGALVLLRAGLPGEGVHATAVVVPGAGRGEQ